jgi:hypothetical protein
MARCRPTPIGTHTGARPLIVRFDLRRESAPRPELAKKHLGDILRPRGHTQLFSRLGEIAKLVGGLLTHAIHVLGRIHISWTDRIHPNEWREHAGEVKVMLLRADLLAE